MMCRWRRRCRTKRALSSEPRERCDPQPSVTTPPPCCDGQPLLFLQPKGRESVMALLTVVAMQAQSAKLIGEAVQQNPAFLMLRRIEVWVSSCFDVWAILPLLIGDLCAGVYVSDKYLLCRPRGTLLPPYHQPTIGSTSRPIACF